MRTIQTWIIWLLCSLVSGQAGAQDITVVGQDNTIYRLEARLMKGDPSALFDMAPYFDSQKKVIEFLGHHRIETTEATIAKRIVTENSLFTPEECSITASSTTKQFLDFLHENKDKIVFSALASSFLLTPLDKRPIAFEIRAISETRKKELRDSMQVLLRPDWVKHAGIDSLIRKKDPVALLLVASEFFKVRSRFNRYYFYEEQFTNLLQCLTGTEIGVENEQGAISWHIDKDYDPMSKLHLLIYFSEFYKQYTWDDKAAAFINGEQVVKPVGKEGALFQLLNHKNDSIARNAFMQLTVGNPEAIAQLADEYKNADIEKSDAIPTFPYTFLKQLAQLTAYCRSHHISLAGTKEMQRSMARLQLPLSFADRRKLEDRLIRTLTLDDITAFEYQAIIHERSWELPYSAGRILDIFYSKNWNRLLAGDQYLECYLKKAALFGELGIVGVCNNYLRKFSGSSAPVLERLKNLSTNDTAIRSQIEKVISQHNSPDSGKIKTAVSWEGNKDCEVKDMEKQLSELINNAPHSPKTDNAISEILSRISYRQIPAALKAIADYPFETAWKKYSFMERDWGFFLAGDFDKKETRDEFLKLYVRSSEYQLYACYLDKGAIDYKTADNRLDYDKIYELLKYDVVTSFVGGGTRDNEVYAVVKLLELTFKTTLGFPDKLCNSNNVYGCDSDERAKAWMTYMIERKLLQQKHDEPVSFHFE